MCLSATLGLMAALLLWAAPTALASGPYSMSISAAASGDTDVELQRRNLRSHGSTTPSSVCTTLNAALAAGSVSVGDGGTITIQDPTTITAGASSDLTFNGP